MPFWNTRPSRTALHIRKGGPGNPWQVLDVEAQMEAFSGGGQGVESRWGRNENGDFEYVGAVVTENPARIEGNVSMRRKSETFLRNLTILKCPVDLRLVQRCGEIQDIINWTEAELLYDAITTEGPVPSDTPANNAEDIETDLMDQYSISAGFLDRWVKLQHVDISASWADFGITKIISVGKPVCIGDCTGVQLTGEEEFWAVTKKDSTPGYAGAATPVFLFTTDNGANFSASYITPFLNGDALDVVKAGQFVLVASATNGVAYAAIQDLKDGVLNPWKAATGFPTSANYPRRLFVVNASLIYAAGTGGYVWKSTDGGLSWTAVHSGTLTTQTLNGIHFVDENLGWVVGNAGTLLKYNNGTFTLVTVASGLTANLNVVRVPRQRGREVYVGTASGLIYKSVNTGKTFTNTAFPDYGNGSVVDLQFAGFRGSVLFIVQSNIAGTKSRVMRDESGGALGNQVAIIGSYDDPANSLMNSIAPANVNYALTAGELDGSFAFIGKVSKV